MTDPLRYPENHFIIAEKEQLACFAEFCANRHDPEKLADLAKRISRNGPRLPPHLIQRNTELLQEVRETTRRAKFTNGESGNA